MKLRSKTIFVVGLTFIGLIILLQFTISLISEQSYSQLEKAEVIHDVENTLRLFSDNLSGLDTKASDWGPWDDTFKFIEDHNQEYIQSNLIDSTFTNLKINLMAFIDNSGAIVYAKAYDLDNSQEIPVPTEFQQQISNDGPLHKLLSKNRQQSGLLILDTTPLLIAAYPILTSEMKGPARGYILMGRYLDQMEVERMIKLTGQKLSFYRIDHKDLPSDVKNVIPGLLKNTTVGIQPLDANTIAGYSLIQDIYGKSVLLLKIEQPRNIYKQSRLTQSAFLYSLMILGIFFSILISMLLHQFILKRLSHLRSDIAQIGKSGRLSQRLSLSGKDEITDFAGEINRMLENIEDYYQQLQASEKRLQDQLEFQQILMDTIPIPVYSKDVEGKFLDCNTAFELNTGISKKELEGKTVYDIADQELADFHSSMDSVLFKNPGNHMYEYWFQHQDGSRREAIFYKATFKNSCGSVGGFVGAILDITERKQAIEALRERELWIRNVLDSINVGVLIVDPSSHKIVEVNQSAADMFGASKEDILGSLCHQYICPAEIGKCPITDLGKTVENAERFMIGKNGELHPIIKTVRLVSRNGWPLLLESFIDNSERKKAEAAKAELEEQLRQSQKMEAVGQLTAGIAHNFNNLLTGIIGHIHLAKKKAPQSILSYLETAILGGQKAADMIHQLMLFTRGAKAEFQSLDLNRIIQDVEKICRQTFDKKIDILVETVSDLPPVFGNPSQLHQVLLNLCINARDAVEPIMDRPGQIQIRTQIQSLKNQPYIVLEVADNGIGMDQETEHRIFDPFFTTKEVGKGTGLGLTTVYGIVKQHQGMIEVKSQPGEGAVFRVLLPIGVHEASRMEKMETDLPTGSETVLVVDDDETIRILVQNILEEAGYEVLLAKDGEEGLQIFQGKREQIQIILLDLSMPKLSGYEVLSQLLVIDSSIRVIISSGYVVDLHDLQGAKAVCNKPFAERELLQTIRRVLDSR